MPRSKRRTKNKSAESPQPAASGWRRVPNDVVVVDAETGGPAKWNLSSNPRKTRAMLDAEHARKKALATALPTVNRLKHIIGEVPRYADFSEPAQNEHKENIPNSNLLPTFPRAQARPRVGAQVDGEEPERRGPKLSLVQSTQRSVKDEPVPLDAQAQMYAKMPNDYESDSQPEIHDASCSFSSPEHHALRAKPEVRTPQNAVLRTSTSLVHHPETEDPVDISPLIPNSRRRMRRNQKQVKDEPQLFHEQASTSAEPAPKSGRAKPRRKARRNVKHEPLQWLPAEHSELEMHDAPDGTPKVKYEHAPKNDPVPYAHIDAEIARGTEDEPIMHFVLDDDVGEHTRKQPQAQIAQSESDDDDAFASANDEPVPSDATRTPDTVTARFRISADNATFCSANTSNITNSNIITQGGLNDNGALTRNSLAANEVEPIRMDDDCFTQGDLSNEEQDDFNDADDEEEESITPRSNGSLNSFLVDSSDAESDEGDWTPGSFGSSASGSEAISSPDVSLRVENAELRAEVAELRRGMRRLLRQQQYREERSAQLPLRQHSGFAQAFAELTDDELVPSPRYDARCNYRDVHSESERSEQSEEERYEGENATPSLEAPIDAAPSVNDQEFNSRMEQLVLDENEAEFLAPIPSLHTAGPTRRNVKNESEVVDLVDGSDEDESLTNHTSMKLKSPIESIALVSSVNAAKQIKAEQEVRLDFEEVKSVNEQGAGVKKNRKTRRKRKGQKEIVDWGWRRVENDVIVVDAQTGQRADWTNSSHARRSCD